MKIFRRFRTPLLAIAALVAALAPYLVHAQNYSSVAVLDGSAGAPSITFFNDTDTGFYRVSANTIGISVGGTQIGSINSSGLAIGTLASPFTTLTTTATIDFASTNSNLCSAETAVTVTGAVAGDAVVVGVPNASAGTGSTFPGRVSAADTVQVKFCNLSAGAVDPASGSFRVVVIKF